MTPEVRVTRIVEFSAAHRLHSPRLSPETNRSVFGKCNNPNGHGHTYRLEATVAGPLDPETGLLPAASRLDAALAELVLERLDGANLDVDVPELADTSGTTEELARLLERLLAEAVGPALVRVVLHETPNNVFEASGGG
jgi:6-pyruvoyltetrahydropterin/6-carboxytetrahydropterin synthase